MKQKVCKGCFEVFTDFTGEDYCNMCGREIESGESGWLDLESIEKEVKTDGNKK